MDGLLNSRVQLFLRKPTWTLYRRFGCVYMFFSPLHLFDMVLICCLCKQKFSVKEIGL
jgi:hypothetical protein